jgi:hypothetical protein
VYAGVERGGIELRDDDAENTAAFTAIMTTTRIGQYPRLFEVLLFAGGR